ncbi:MAG: tRNA (adenosine(37)-N6)-threonylcarbamoyltransferase complex ATPase subunit type 1 TsaE [Lachnospiraceae bacterium]|nr:tRNA (adenosine(37)-N6)-threonylcarbamoyltransferase complex ATPase subunit type 1 TsaE [Lachnospiraceae bacterium]
MEEIIKEGVFEVNSPDETLKLGEEFAKATNPGTVIALVGDLGVGKTVFTKGIAKGLGIADNVTSPTFTILESYYDGRMPLHHFDVYRIGDVEEMEEVGFDDCVYSEGITIIEWAGIIEEIIPKGTYVVNIEKDLSRGNDYRKITITKTTKEGYLN